MNFEEVKNVLENDEESINKYIGTQSLLYGYYILPKY